MSVTQVEIAKKLGISQRTVSVAFAGKGRINAKTRDRIIGLAREMGYRPNAAARAMRKGRFNSIGLLSSIRINEAALHPVALWAVQQEMAQREMQLVMSPIPDQKLLQEGALPQILRQWAVDGLLVSYTFNAPETLVEMLARHRVPAIWMNTRLQEDCVYLDDYRAGREATERLLALGHRKISYVGFRSGNNHYSGKDRRQGYLDAMASAGLTPDEFNQGNLFSDELAAPGAVRQWLSRADRPTGIVTYEEGEAGVIVMAAAALQLNIPRDISLCSMRMGSHPFHGIALSGMEVRPGVMGHRAIELLIEKIAIPGRKLPPALIPPRPLEGQTVGAVSA